MIYRYPKEVHDFVKKWAPKLRDDDLAKACNETLGTQFTTSGMKSFRGNHGYRNGKKQWTKEEYWKYQKRYPEGMYEFIRDNSWGVSSREMAEMVNEKFGTTFSQTMMKQFRQRHGIKSGVTGWYQKGHPPGNKGKTLEEYAGKRAAEIREKISGTQFKKGQKPANLKQVGDITVVSGYKLRKKQMEGSQWERWEFLHRAVWEEANGPVPEGCMVSFKDGNPLNCELSNLMLLTQRENAQMTRLKFRFEDPDLTDTALNVVRLRNTVLEKRKRKKKAAGTKENGGRRENNEQD